MNRSLLKHAWQFFKVAAENTLEWDSVDVKQPTTTTTNTNKGGMYRVNPNFKTDAKITAVMRRLEALEMSKGAQSLALESSKPVVSPVWVLCDSQDHLAEQCPGLPIIKAKQANVLNIFLNPNPNNNSFSETYNLG